MGGASGQLCIEAQLELLAREAIAHSSYLPDNKRFFSPKMKDKGSQTIGTAPLTRIRQRASIGRTR